MSRRERILIIGAGGHAQVVADILRAMEAAGAPVEILGYVDDNPKIQERRLAEIPVLGPVAQWPELNPDALVVAIGNNATRAQLQQAIHAAGGRLFVAQHPRAVVAPDVSLGPGTVVAAGVVVNTGTVIGAGVILNTGCTVDHHNQIGDFAHIAPGAHLTGEVTVEEGVLVGAGAVVIPQCHIGAWAIVGAGAVVVQDVPASTTVAGVPARPIYARPIEEGKLRKAD